MFRSSNTVGVIGMGNMGKALIKGIAASHKSYTLMGSARTPETCRAMEKDYNMMTTTDNQEIMRQAATVIVAVKPKDVQAVLTPLKASPGQRIISLAAGVRIASIERWLRVGSSGAQVIRCMPNIAASERESSSVLVSNSQVTAAEEAAINALIGCIGTTHWVDNEDQFDAAATVSGCGPAYLFYMLEKQIEGLVKLGVPEEKARAIAIQTAYGAAMLVDKSSVSPEALRTKVTTPNGMTFHAIQQFEAADMSAITLRALAAAKRRCESYGQELDIDHPLLAPALAEKKRFFKSPQEEIKSGPGGVLEP